MPLFQYKKLYTDIITNDGTVGILYLTWLRLLGGKQVTCGLELYAPDGTKTTYRGTGQPSSNPGEHSKQEYIFSFPIENGTVTCHVESLHQPWTPGGESPIHGIQWMTRSPRANVSISIQQGTTTTDLYGKGYSDWVILDRFPKNIPLSTLQWGRIHLDAETLIYTLLTYQSNEQWARIGRWNDTGLTEAESMTLTQEQDNWTLHSTLIADNTVTLLPQRILHQGKAINKERFPNTIERWLSQWISGPMSEIRWYSQATSTESQGWALHERVQFAK
jgi:hypothetical protein